MTDRSRSDGCETQRWRGPLFSVVVAGPGQLRWSVVVRAADAESARAMVEARGHIVLAVRDGPERGPVATRPVLGDCMRCGYALARLPAGEAGEVMCPECGIINTPAAPLDARLDVLRRKRSRMRLWVYGMTALFGFIVILVASLAR